MSHSESPDHAVISDLSHELIERPSRSPDHAGEAAALALLASEMAANPRGVLQKLAELVCDVVHVSTAGISILEPGPGGGSGLFRWRAVAGALSTHAGGTIPQDASPCGIVVSRNRTLLFKRPAKLFPVLNSVQPRVEEALLVPWHVGGKAVGTVWAISHDPDRHFDAEDGRLLRSLSRFASAGWQTISALDEADAARREIEGLLATLALGNLMARDLDGTIRFWSEGCTRLFGWTAAEATGRNAPDLLQTIYPALRAEIETALERNGEWTGDLRQRARDGRELTVSAHKVLRRASEDRPAMVLESLTDVTDQRRAEATLHESQKRLQELQAELLHASRLSVMGQMLAALAHELNQPLTAVAAYLQACQQMLENSAPPPPDLVEALELASEQVERSGQIIHRLRSFLSRNAAEKRPEPVVNLLKEAVALAQTGSKEIPVTLEFRSPSNTSWVLADRVQIQQVLLNLIRNAIEAMAGLEKRQISITAEPQGEMVCFGVADAGTGISAKIEPQLFQPFVTTKNNGMGLGLSICRTIVEEHGGRIWAEPSPGGGTVFRFTLPAASQPDITYG